MITANVLACSVILGWACWACLNQNVNDGVLGKFIFACIAMAALSVILGNTTGTTTPSGPGTTLHLAMAALGLRHIALKHIWPHVIKRLQLRMRCPSCPMNNNCPKEEHF